MFKTEIPFYVDTELGPVRCTAEGDFLSAADSAAAIRSELRVAFRGVKFFVRSRRYAGGASVDVRWTDGPTAAAVDAVVDRWRGADVDAGDDSVRHRGGFIAADGRLVRSGADFVSVERHASAHVLHGVVRAMMYAELFPRCDRPAVRCGTSGSWPVVENVAGMWHKYGAGNTPADVAHRIFRGTEFQPGETEETARLTVARAIEAEKGTT